jgi:broad specificity phosphatase PhoE
VTSSTFDDWTAGDRYDRAVRLILVRHGESEGNAGGIVQGRLDFGLTARGMEQARLAAEYLAGHSLDRLASSPLRRARETAEVFAERLGLPLEFDDALQEYDMGAVSGLNAGQIRERFPEIVAAWQKGIRPAFPGAEDRTAFHARVRTALDRLTALDEAVVAIAHGGVVASMCYAVVGAEPDRRGLFETANCAITEITRDRSGRLVLARVNDTCHLEGRVTFADRG